MWDLVRFCVRLCEILWDIMRSQCCGRSCRLSCLRILVTSVRLGPCILPAPWSEGKTIWDSVRLWEILWDFVRFYETLWNSMRLFEILWDFLRFYETLWESMRLFEILWDFMRFYETFWDSMRLYEILRTYLPAFTSPNTCNIWETRAVYPASSVICERN